MNWHNMINSNMRIKAYNAVKDLNPHCQRVLKQKLGFTVDDFANAALNAEFYSVSKVRILDRRFDFLRWKGNWGRSKLFDYFCKTG